VNIITYEVGRVTLLFPLEETIPLGGVNEKEIVEKIISRYNFASRADHLITKEDKDKSGLRFLNGILLREDGEKINIVDFAIYTDGIVINAKSTDNAVHFLEDVLKWMREENSFREFITPPKRRFLSQIVVEFDRPMAGIISLYHDINGMLSHALEEIYEEKISYGLGKLEFEFDKTSRNASMIVPKFYIERRFGVSYERERYYCGAPFKTQTHIEILQEIERRVS
jgi:hypothetical protein